MIGLKTLLYAFAMFGATGPTEEDWQTKIDECINEYWEVVVKLPRKQKKKRKIALQKEYDFLLRMQKWSASPFN